MLGKNNNIKLSNQKLIVSAVVFGIFLLNISIVAAETSDSGKITDFNLNDPEGNVYSIDSFKKKYIIFAFGIASNRKQGTEFDELLDAIYTNYKNNPDIDVVGIYELSGIPFFMKTFCIRQFKLERKKDACLALLDWKGKFYNENNAKHISVVLTNRQRDILYKNTSFKIEDIKYLDKKIKSVNREK